MWQSGPIEKRTPLISGKQGLEPPEAVGALMCSLFLWSSVLLTLKLLNEKTTLGMNKGP